MGVEMALSAAIVVSLMVTNTSNVGAILGNLVNPVVWLIVFISFDLSGRFHKSNSYIVYFYVGVMSTIYRYIEITKIMPAMNGARPYVTFNRMFWAIVAAILLTIIVKSWINYRRNKQNPMTPERKTEFLKSQELRIIAPSIALQNGWQHAVSTIMVTVNNRPAYLYVNFEEDSIGLIYEDRTFEKRRSSEMANISLYVDNKEGIIHDILVLVQFVDRSQLVGKFLWDKGRSDDARVARQLSDAMCLNEMLQQLKAMNDPLYAARVGVR